VLIEPADYRVHRQRQVRPRGLQRLQSRPRFHGPAPVSRHTPDVVVLVADSVQAEIDPNLAFRAFGANPVHALGDPVGQQAVSRDGDDGRPAVTIGADHHFVQILTQNGSPVT
jgi:hypothetical protein